MKNYKVEATMKFTDKEEKIRRNVGDEFVCTKERYEYLKNKNAVKLIEIVEEKEFTEEEVQWTVTEEDDAVHVRPVVDGEIVDTPVETVEEPKKKKTNKK